jgi:dipeptidyl-peptidase-4
MLCRIKFRSILFLILLFFPLYSLALVATPKKEVKKLTIERLYSDPRLPGIPPKNVVFSQDGSKIFFLWNEKGIMTYDLWCYDISSGKSEKLLAAVDISFPKRKIGKEEAELRERMRTIGSGITSFSLSPDGSLILFPYQGDIYLFEIEKRKLKRLCRTRAWEVDPKFSPDGKYISFIRENDIWAMELETVTEIQLTTSGSDTILNGIGDFVALEELGRYSSYFWSPDSQKIAYVSADVSPVPVLLIPDYLAKNVSVVKQRRPKAGDPNAIERVGVVSLESGKTTWTNLGEDTDYYIVKLVWSPDGKKLAFTKEQRDLKSLELLVFSPEEGKTEKIYQDKDPCWVNIQNQYIYWLSPEKILLTSERSGYNHAYLLNIKEKKLDQLTTGDWEVTGINRIANDQIYFTATKVGPAERHLFRIPLTGGELERLTGKPGWHTAIISPDAAYIADIFTDVVTPAELYLAPLGSKKLGRRITRSPAADFASYRVRAPEFISYKSRLDGADVPAMLFKPQRIRKGKKYPAIIRIHGGGYAQSVQNAFSSTNLFHLLLNERGFVVLDVDYRGSSGYGRKWRTDVYLNLGGPDLEDTVSGVIYLRNLPYIDRENIGIWGWSYGGFMTNIAMLKAAGWFKAGAAVAPVNDWRNYDTQYTEERLGLPEENPEAYLKGSPITYAENLKGHLLMIHGMADDNVHFEDTVKLVDTLLSAGKVDFDVMIYPQGKHGIRRDASRISLYRKIIRHFERYLK